MIVGVGIDVVATPRWARALDKIKEQVFTPRELAACADRLDRIDALAARFAAKEACIKALRAGIREGGLRQIEIVSSSDGAPQLRISGALAERARECGARTAHVSLTHQPDFAAAVVILEGTPTAAHTDEPWTLETVLSGTW